MVADFGDMSRKFGMETRRGGDDPVRLGMQIAFGRVRRKTAPTVSEVVTYRLNDKCKNDVFLHLSVYRFVIALCKPMWW